MSNNLTVVMYHYVRDLQNSRYPEIKGLDSNLFVKQLDYICKHYNVITMEQMVEAAREGGKPLPDHPLLLTFDDGYSDHFNTVFPILYNRGLQGSFFAPVKAIEENILLDVNKIHFILASSDNTGKLLDRIKELLDNYREQYNLDTFDNYYAKLAAESRFDSPEIIFIKRLLQVELPEEARGAISDDLFLDIVGIDQAAFARELYMDKEQMKCMIKAGMHIGSHCYNHIWLDSLDKAAQEKEIVRSIEFVRDIYDGNNDIWTICFPYGAYNDDTLDLLKRYDCAAGFSTKVEVANLSSDSILTLPRLDTNDLPKQSDAPVNKWYCN